AVIIHTNGHKGAYVVSLTLNSVDNYMIRIRILVRPSVLRMEIGFIFPNFRQRIVDLIIKTHRFIGIYILNRDPAFFTEGHFPETVEGTTRVDRHRDGIQGCKTIPGHA